MYTVKSEESAGVMTDDADKASRAAADQSAPGAPSDTSMPQNDGSPPPMTASETVSTKVGAKVRLSDMLVVIARDERRERISIGDLLDAMDARAMGALLLIFALPNVLPNLPGTSAVLGLPLVYLTSQMMLGRLPWLPKFIANRSVSRNDFAALIARMEPWLAWAERFLRPRLSWLAREWAERLIGGVALVLSVIVFLPIPFGNMLPALAICLFALGLMERDGVWVIAGMIASVLAAVVVAGVVFALLKSVIFVLQGAF